MRPVRLQIAGLRSWRTERELLFDDVDLAAVVGPTGAGKSSILEAIAYALYNSATYSKQPGTLISSDTKTMSVTLDFDADGERWRATRSISRGNYPPAVHKLACLSSPGDHPMVEGGGAVNAAIEELIGLSRDEFLAAVLLPQGKFQTLLIAQPALRAAILKGVFRLDELDEIREQAVQLRRDQVEPTLETRRAERQLLLPDPAAAWTAAKADVKNCKGMVQKLEEIKGRYDGLVTQGAEQTARAEATRLSADAFEQAAKAIPALGVVVELEAAFSLKRQELEAQRRSQLGKRTAAQTKLDEAAKVSLTPESLTKAQHVLESAAAALPNLDDDASVLAEAQKELADQKSALAEEESAYRERAAKLAQSENEVARLEAASASAEERRSNASDSLRSLRTAAGKVLEAQGQLVEQEETLRKSSTALESAESEAAKRRAAVEGAEKVLEAARAAHEAAHLAAGLKPGELCPVCQQDLPAGFKPPKTPQPLQSAEKEVKRLRTEAEEAARLAAAAAANVKTLTTQVKELKTTVSEAEAVESAARKEAANFLGTVDLSKDDAELLAELTEAASAAKTKHQEVRDELLVVKGTLEKAGTHLAERALALAKRTEELEQEAGRIAREREAHSTALSELPAEFKAKSKKPGVLAEAASRCQARLGELHELQDSVRNAVEEIEALDEQLTTLASERAEKIDTPRRDAATQAQAIAAKLREVDSTAKVPRLPADNAELPLHIDWIQEVVALALAKGEALRALAAGDEAAAAEAVKAAEKVLKSASKLAENELATADEFAKELDSWRARLLAAERERDQAKEQKPLAAHLDKEIESLIKRREALEELAYWLGDGHFVKWLVERRQQLLLVVASEVLAGMTGERYRFAADFTIIDGRTGIPRHPTTLSGGESFMASLALALGMAEIAARGGGRIGSLYLDEGFGSLDPNALDEAITALELRARAGQMILIVSHVPSIAQRIERVLRVSPNPVGSEAEWIDDTDREALLVEAAAGELT